MLDSTSAPFTQRGKKLKLSSDGGDSGNNKMSEAIVALMMRFGLVCIWRESGVRQSVFYWCVCQECCYSRRVNVYILNLAYYGIL
jgi:hypothetical protein